MMPKVVFFSSTAYNDLLGKSSGQKKKKVRSCMQVNDNALKLTTLYFCVSTM